LLLVYRVCPPSRRRVGDGAGVAGMIAGKTGGGIAGTIDGIVETTGGITAETRIEATVTG